jgi:undecaprenyl pyrophosphate phosphatase UppP
LLNLINKNKFSNFAWYCLVLGIITLILALV